MKPFSAELLTILCLGTSIWAALTLLAVLIVPLVYLCWKCAAIDNAESRRTVSTPILYAPPPVYQHPTKRVQTPSDQFSLQTPTMPDEPLSYIQGEREKRKTTSNSFRFLPHFRPVERETPYPADVLRQDRLMRRAFYRAQDQV